MVIFITIRINDTSMIEVIELFFVLLKGFFRMLFEVCTSGSWFDISLRGTGRFTIRYSYPPHWKKKTTYGKGFERSVGLVIWFLLFYIVGLSS